MDFANIVSTLYSGTQLALAKRLTGGVSAEVYRLDLKARNGSTSSVVLRIHGARHSGHPAELEYRLLSALHGLGMPVPEPLKVDATGMLVPDPFLIMTYIKGSTMIPAGHEEQCIKTMAQTLRRIHELPMSDLPELPERRDPIPELFDFLPCGPEWLDLHSYLQSLTATSYTGSPSLLHGDFWPENLLWKGGRITAILDWEDAAVGDPLSDVAAAAVELRYKFGKPAMQRFTQNYARYQQVNHQRLALWQIYVAAAAQHFMHEWGLPAAREAHMRKEALASIREAAAVLMTTA